MPDDNPLICPLCGQKLVFIGVHGPLQTYRCSTHGPMVYEPDRCLRPESQEETEARIRRLPPSDGA